MKKLVLTDRQVRSHMYILLFFMGFRCKRKNLKFVGDPAPLTRRGRHKRLRAPAREPLEFTSLVTAHTSTRGRQEAPASERVPIFFFFYFPSYFLMFF